MVPAHMHRVVPVFLVTLQELLFITQAAADRAMAQAAQAAAAAAAAAESVI
jgi:hypothetical protein